MLNHASNFHASDIKVLFGEMFTMIAHEYWRVILKVVHVGLGCEVWRTWLVGIPSCLEHVEPTIACLSVTGLYSTVNQGEKTFDKKFWIPK